MKAITVLRKISKAKIKKALKEVAADSIEKHLLMNIWKGMDDEDLSTLFAIDCKGKVAGALNYFNLPGEELHIKDFIVVPSRQQKGIGSMLLTAMTATATSLGRTALTIFSLDGSVGFYKAKGFQFPDPEVPDFGYLTLTPDR